MRGPWNRFVLAGVEVILGCLLSFWSGWAQARVPLVVEDLSSVAFSKGQVKTLDEGWPLFWGVLLDPLQPLPVEADAALTPLSDFTQLGVIEGSSYPYKPAGGLGAASFVRLVKGLLPQPQGYDLSMSGASTAYRVCAYPQDRPEHQVCEEVGKPGLDRASTIPKTAPSLITFFPESADQTWVLLYQLSNFHSYTGGMRFGAPELAQGGVLRVHNDKAKWNNFAVLGFLAAIMAYSGMLWLRRKEDRASLALCILCGATLLRLAISTQIVFAYLPTTTLAFHIKYAAEFASLALTPLAYIWFIHEAFPEATFGRFFWGFCWLAIPATLFPMVTDTTVFTKQLLVYQVYLLSTMVFGITVLVRSRMKRLEGSGVAMLGAVLVAFSTLWDVLVGRGVLPSPYIAQFGIAAFMFLQGQVIAGRFATAFRTAEFLSRSLQEEVDRQLKEIKDRTAEIRSVMDNIPEGIVYITDPNGHLSQVRSSFLDQIFHADKSMTTLDELLGPTDLPIDEKAKIHSIVSSSLGEDEITWEINVDHLPSSVIIPPSSPADHGHERIIDLAWHPVFSEEGQTTKVLVTAHDVTKLRLIEKRAHEKTIEAQRLNEVIGNKSFLLRRFFRAADEILDSVGQHWKGLVSGNIEDSKIGVMLSSLYGSLHTLKGMARTLKFTELSSLVHSAEDPLFHLVRGHGSVATGDHNGDSVASLREIGWSDKLAAIQSSYHHYRSIYEDIAREWGRQDSQDALLAKDFAREMLEPELPLALELGKEKPHLQIDGGSFQLSSMQTKIMQQVLVHMIRNALDHGLERGEERLKKGKDLTGTIFLNLMQKSVSGQEPWLLVNFQDDGQGLDLGRLRKKALELHVLKDGEADDADLIVGSLFKEGFSSKETVSDISGRGVGMGEVKRLIEMVGGAIHLVPCRTDSWSQAAAQGNGPHAFRIEIALPAVDHHESDA